MKSYSLLQGLPSDSSVMSSPPCLPLTITPLAVPPPCTSSSSRNGDTTPQRRTRGRADSGSSRLCQSADYSTVAFSNGIPQLVSQQRSCSEKECSSSGASGTNRSDSRQLSCTDGVSTSGMQRNSAHRTSQTALNGLVIGVGGAAVVYAAVSALLRR